MKGMDARKRRRYFLHSKKGGAAVFLAMALAGMIAVTAVLLEGACAFAAGSYMEGVCDLAARSVLSSYHRQLREDYGLFAMEAREEKIEGDLSYFIDGTFNRKKKGKELLSLIAVRQKNVFADVSPFLLIKPDVVLEQILDYMKYRALALGWELSSEAWLGAGLKESAGALELARQKEEEAAQAEREQEEEDRARREEAAENPQDADPEADEEESRRRKEKKRLSQMLKEQRQRNEGEGTGEEREDRVLRNRQMIRQLPSRLTDYAAFPDLGGVLGKDPEELLLTGRDSLYLDEYILLQFSSFAGKKQGKETFFQNEAEYILCGHPSDERNRKQVKAYLFTLRAGLNLSHIYGDPAKRQLTLNAALAIAPGPAAPAAQLLIATLWAGGESEQDVAALYNGERVPFVKGREDWKTDLEGILSGALAPENPAGKEGGRGQSYEDYLRLFLLLSGRESRLIRLMDLIQLNMRLRYEKDFRVADYCGGFFFRADLARKNGFMMPAGLLGGRIIEKVHRY